MTRLRSISFTVIIGLLLSVASAAAPHTARIRAAETPSKYAKLEGFRVHYTSSGNGREALVFVHGWTCNMSFWRDQVPAFEGKHRVILIDLPGHGQSDKPQVAYTMDLFARAVDAVLRDAGIDRAVLVGHSMGTPVIREFYRKYPQKTLGLVVVDGTLRAFGDRKMMETFIAPLRGPDYKERASRFIEGMFGPQATPALREQIKTAMLSTPQSVAVSAMEGMAEESIWKQDKIEVPVLVILARSPLLPADNEQFLRSLIPKLDYQVWDGVGHFLMMEKPKEFNEAVIAFLDKQRLLKK